MTGTIEAKLDFKKFREFREVTSIKETYKFVRVLGEGSFGKVYECIHKPTQSSCAIKVVLKNKLREHKVYEQLMISELQTLDTHEHPHIVRVLDLCED